MYRIAVCEDEEILREELCAQCNRILTELQVDYAVVPFSSAEALEGALAEGEAFSLLCLDILMGGKTGMELAQDVRKRDEQTSIVFITSSTEFLKDGYSVRPIQYLLKPVQQEELAAVIRTDLRLYHRPRTANFRVGGKTIVLPLEHILYVESRDHGSVLHLAQGEQFVPWPLSQTEETLPKEQFCRCHNSFLVNFSHIREVSGRRVYLLEGDDLNIGRRYMEQFQNAFVRYLNRN